MIREESIQIPFAYAAGTAASKFLIALRDDGAILGSRCRPCARVLAPARPFCPQCGGEELSEIEIGPGGTVVSWTERPGDGIFALIRLDGADTALLHSLLVPAAEVSTGMRVRARFARERNASITDIEGFEPEGAAP